MHVSLWEFQVKAGSEEEFERTYGAQGEWVNFFKKGEGYAGTDLLRNVGKRGRYITVDRWTSQAAFEDFQKKNKNEYQAIDKRCKSLTRVELHLGYFIL